SSLASTSPTNYHGPNNIEQITCNELLTNPVGDFVIMLYVFLFTISGWLSCLGNGVVILLLVKQRHSLEPQDLLTLNLAVSDAGVAIFGYSRGILEIFNLFRDDGLLIKTIWTCQVDGFLIMLFGLISINTLTSISVVRYIKGCQPSYAHYNNHCNVAVVIVAVWLCALFWAGAPLVGWGSYTARKYGTCEIDWVQARFSVSYRLYVILIFTFNFFIPFVVIWFSYVSIIRTVNNSHKSSRGGAVSERENQMERSITTVSLILCSAFLLAWSPYAVISMWSACGHQVPPLHSILASLFAKSASSYNPFIYLGLNSKFRQDFRAQELGKLGECEPALTGRLAGAQLNLLDQEEKAENNTTTTEWKEVTVQISTALVVLLLQCNNTLKQEQQSIDTGNIKTMTVKEELQ
uniref:Opsin 6, group member b n=1 Tax=Oncorhynchus kisutch TaxID=8019 RepID=A0A8C7FMJ2_ONCKI